MQWGRPKSLSGLMLVGLALMAGPLLVAILTAVLQIRDLADTGQKLVVQGVTGARASQALFAQIASLERTARLYEVLKDPKLLELYRTQDERLSAIREQLRGQAASDARATLEERTLKARKTLLVWVAALVPLALIAVLMLTLLLGRPLRQLDRAISELG